MKPEYAEAFNNRGAAYADEKQRDRAIEDFSAAIGLRPGYAEAFNFRGAMYVYQGQSTAPFETSMRPSGCGQTLPRLCATAPLCRRERTSFLRPPRIPSRRSVNNRRKTPAAGSIAGVRSTAIPGLLCLSTIFTIFSEDEVRVINRLVILSGGRRGDRSGRICGCFSMNFGDTTLAPAFSRTSDFRSPRSRLPEQD